MSKLQQGITGQATARVTENNTAMAYGSGGVRVFATPAMIGLMENAALNSVEKLLDDGLTTVGTRVDVQHMAATPVGMSVTAKTELTEVDGKRLVFKVEAYDDKEMVGKGIHERYIVPLEKFLARATAKQG